MYAQKRRRYAERRRKYVKRRRKYVKTRLRRRTKVGKPVDVRRLVEELDPDDVGDLDKLLGEKGKHVDRLVHVVLRVEETGDAVRSSAVTLAVLRAGSCQREEGRKKGREGGKKGGREEGREGEREGERKEGREGGRKAGRQEGRKNPSSVAFTHSRL
jgi:hypothetical protein